jgi:hypothetical protein
MASKNANHDNSLPTTSEEFVSPDNNEIENLKQIVEEVEKGESALEGGEDKILKLGENNCNVDKTIQPLNDEISKHNKNAEHDKNKTFRPSAKPFTENTQEHEPIVAVLEKEESSVKGEAKMIFKVDVNTIKTFNNNICKDTKNGAAEESTEKNTLSASFAEFVQPENNPELEKIVEAVEKGESTLEGGADKILKLAEKVCNIDKILSTLTEEICKRTKSNAVPVLMYTVISEALLHIFDIGSGAAKLDFTAIR